MAHDSGPRGRAAGRPWHKPLAAALAVAMSLCGCGGGSSPSPPPPPPTAFTVGGTVTGLTAAGLVLANGPDTVSPAAGAMDFTFRNALASGASYAVTVKTQPTNELCQVGNGSGQVGSAAVTSVAVTCARAWTWVGGSNTRNSKGTYGTQGVAAADNVPGARFLAVTWTDRAGDLWLFGGYGFDSTTAFANLNDLWRYSPGSGQWSWVSGGTTINAQGVYGAMGAATAGSVPGARRVAVSWIDGAGNLWLFGGWGFDSAGLQGDLNDLWRYNPGSGVWTWVGGSNMVNATGVYGVQGVAAAGNAPGARDASVSWTDGAGNLWLFGGEGNDATLAGGLLNDLWRYDAGGGQWTWISGSSTVGAVGVYGTPGVAATGNAPGGRYGSVSWTDGAGNLWLFGGTGFDSTGARGLLNDLWRFDPGSGQWTWISGSSTVAALGAYGTQGMAAAGNAPGARNLAVAWTDSAGNLWLFGGNGFGSASGPADNLNDMWRFSPVTGLWTWVSGSNLAAANSVYGTQGTMDAANLPGARQHPAAWTDSAGNVWLLGGSGPDSTGNTGLLNDLWVY